MKQPRRVFRKRPRRQLSWRTIILGLGAALAATPAAIPKTLPIHGFTSPIVANAKTFTK